jgi:2,5-furandicarboxylate decarboxylase 1
MPSDLRTYLDQIGDRITRVTKPVPMDYIGVLTGQASGPVLFENILEYPGWKLVDMLFKNRRWQAEVLRTSAREFLPTLSKRLDEGPRDWRVVTTGPVKEQIFVGDRADLRRLPVPIHSTVDPGPYITGFNILRDPETGRYNSMNPRTLVKGARHAVSSYITRHANAILKKYAMFGTPAPQAIVIGHHPAYDLAAAYSGPHDSFSEMHLVGRLLGEDIEMVQCETIDLVVPAQAEVVIEGLVYPDRREDDGPSPGPMLYCHPWVSQQPRFEITAITMRHDPIYRNVMVTPFTDHQELPRLFHEAILYRRLLDMGVDVHDVVFPAFGGAASCIIQMSPKYEGEVNDALLAVLGSPWLNNKMVVAIDADVDPYDADEVYWAIATRVDPSRQLFIVPNARGNPMDPSTTAVDDGRRRVVGKWGIDATKPVPYKAKDKEFFKAMPKHWGEVSIADFM